MAAQTYEGKPCRHCQEVLRYQSDSSCVTCKKAKASAIPYEKRKAAARKSELKAKYGITPDLYQQMSEQQGHCCAVCKKAPAGKALAVDHDHATGKVRGLLCSNCNTSYGLQGESLMVLMGQLHYHLQQSGETLEDALKAFNWHVTYAIAIQ